MSLNKLEDVCLTNVNKRKIQVIEPSLPLNQKNRLQKPVLSVLLADLLVLRPFDVDRIQALLALLDIVSYFVILLKFFARSWNVHKHILAAIIGFDKAEAFAFIKKFHDSCLHCYFIVRSRKAEPARILTSGE